MPEFAYVARDASGQKVTGTIAAATEREAVAVLSGRSLFPSQIRSDRAAVAATRGRRVSGQVMATTYGQLASLLRSGVPLLRSLSTLKQQSSHATLCSVLEDVHRRVEDGSSLAEAMERHPRAFSPMAVNMVRAGSEGGFLEDALDRVAQFTEQQEDLKSRTVGALAYPIFLAVVGTVIVACLLVFVVPKFGDLFERLRRRGDLPLPTEWLLWFSTTLQYHGWWLLIAALLLAAAVRTQLQSEAGRLLVDRIKFRLPLVGPIIQSLAVARFCRVLGTLLRNGVPILRSLEISRQAAGNRLLSAAVARASENISGGQSLALPLKESGYFPVSVVEMIAVAEESNTLDQVLVDVADGLEKRTARRLDLMVRLLEPVMLLILAFMVLMVVIALLVPILNMSSTL